MASGVGVNPECFEAYKELKLGKKVKYIIYTVNDAKTEIIVDKKSNSQNYDEFVGDLPETECRWAVYDFEFNTAEGTRNKILFYSWSPDESKIRQKMLFASSKDALRRALDGVAVEIQGTEFGEIAKDVVEKKIAGKK